MTAKSLMEEIRELHELNVELMDTLLVIGQRLVEYADKNGIVIEHRDSLALLIGRAQRILALIGTPYRRNPILSDGFRPRDKLTPYRGGGTLDLLLSHIHDIRKATQVGMGCRRCVEDL
jgi:hypothetical protein